MDASSWTGRFIRKLASSSRLHVVLLTVNRFYYAVYEKEGPELMDTLFEETMAELEFAGVRGILQSLKR